MAGAAPHRRAGGARGSRLDAASSAAAHAPRRVTARILAARYERRTRLGHRRAAPGPALDRRGHLGAGGAQSAGAAHAAGPGHAATNGRIRATWCISMSNRSRASPASATGFMAIGGRASEASAGSTRTSRSMTTVAPPTSRSCPIKPARRRRASSSARRVVCAPRRPHHPRPDGQRRQLSQSAVSGRGRPPQRSARHSRTESSRCPSSP